jgi:ribosome maturation factor RimP
MQEGERLFERLEPLLAEAGLALVDLGESRRGGFAQVRMTIYSPGGTGTDECAQAHRIAYPAIEAFLGVTEPELEVSSPGIERVLRSPREWAIFKGKGVRVLLRDETEWIQGRIEGAEGGKLRLALPDGPMDLELEAVAKARLDSSAERLFASRMATRRGDIIEGGD